MKRIPAQVAKLGLATLLALSFAVAPGTPAASPALAAGCPTGPVTIGKLVRLFESSTGGRACYGGRLLTFRTFVQQLCNECGGTSAALVTPLWLNGLEGSNVTFSDGPRGGQMTAFVPPGLGRCSVVAKLAACPFRSYYGRWVTVSAHFDGPVAQTCRFDEHPPGPGFSTADAIAACREELIVLSVGSGASTGPGSPPDTATADGPILVGAEAEHRSAPGLLWVGLFLVAGLLSARRWRPFRRSEAVSSGRPIRLVR
jgi:hypothetical protein